MTRYDYIFLEFRERNICPFYERMYPELLIYTSLLLDEEFPFLFEDYVQNAVFYVYRRRRAVPCAVAAEGYPVHLYP